MIIQIQGIRHIFLGFNIYFFIVNLINFFFFFNHLQEEREKKRLAELDRKAEIRALAENEVMELTPKAAPQKITAYQLQVRLLLFVFELKFDTTLPMQSSTMND